MKIIALIAIGIGCILFCGVASIFLWVLISNAFFKSPRNPKIYLGSKQAEPFENQNPAELKACCSDNWRDKHPSQNSDEQHAEQRRTKGVLKVYGSIPAYREDPENEFFGFVTQSGDFNGCQLFQCTRCDQIWAYSDPDYAWRGYFKPVKNIHEKRVKMESA